MNEKQFDFIGFGDPFLDLVVRIDKLPETNKNCPLRDYVFQGGGNVPTATVAAARLGAKASLIGCVGNDLFGKMGIADLKWNGVDTSRMSIQAGKKSNFSICVTESEIAGKEFISKPGDFEEIAADTLDEDFFRQTKMLHVALITPAVAKACDIVHESGGKVSVDANYYRPYTYNYYDKIDIFIGSEMYYGAFCEDKGFDPANYCENMRALSALGPEIVIFTFGEHGCKGIHGEDYFDIPAIPVKVADTTGAGDVFHGAFDVFYLMGNSPRRAAELATGVSAIKCMYSGGRAGIPTLPILTKFLETGELDAAELDARAAHYRRGMMEE